VRRDSKIDTKFKPTLHMPFTDSGNAEPLARRFAGTIRYCWPQRLWYVWNRQRWVPDLSGGMQQRAKIIAREIYREASRIDDSDERKPCVAWARHSESAGARKAAVSLAQSESGIPILPGDFDADPLVLNCLNGTVDLRTGKLRPHCADDLITRLAPVEFDATARCERWETFLQQSTGEVAELLGFLKRAVGYSLTGLVIEEVLFFLHGSGASGKSTFLEALKAALGDYAKVADFESFIARREAGGIRNDIAELVGRRFVVSIEVDEGKKLAEGLVKMITGGDTVRARFLYQESFEFTPQFKLWLAANHAPKVRDNDAAMWRRILRVPFDHVVPKERRDPTLKAALRDPSVSGPAILAWAVKGCLEWQKRGLAVPALVERATEQYRETMDPLKPFFDECCGFDPKSWSSVAKLRSSYEKWAKDSGEKYVLDTREFAQRLTDRGCTPKAGRRRRGWKGIEVLEEC